MKERFNARRCFGLSFKLQLVTNTANTLLFKIKII